MSTETAPASSTALAPASNTESLARRFTTSMRNLTPDEKASAMRGGASIAGGAVGAYLWTGHRVLGFFAGATLGGVAAALTQGKGVRDAVERIVPTATAIGGSLLWKSHPALGFVGGGILGGVANETVVDRLVKRFA